jgi:peroxiredoxin
LGLPYELLSDEKLVFAEKMGLPMFEWEGTKVCKRVTVAVEGGRVVRWWYPVFPPDKNVEEVLAWLRERKGEGRE